MGITKNIQKTKKWSNTRHCMVGRIPVIAWSVEYPSLHGRSNTRHCMVGRIPVIAWSVEYPSLHGRWNTRRKKKDGKKRGIDKNIYIYIYIYKNLIESRKKR